MTRVYIPATMTLLAQIHGAGAVTDVPITAFAVTDGIREWYHDDDVDELEYAANGQAVRASLRLLDADPRAPRRRVVLSADVAESAVTVHDDLERGAVRIAQPVPLSAVVAVHVDDLDAQSTVAAAAAATLEADLGSESAQSAVDDAEGYELSWYGVQELADLLA